MLGFRMFGNMPKARIAVQKRDSRLRTVADTRNGTGSRSVTHPTSTTKPKAASMEAAPSADMRTLAAIAFVGLLAGCGTSQPVTPSSRLIGPPEWAMTPAKELPPLQAGDDAKVSLGQCRAVLGDANAKIPVLQQFAHRVTRPAQ